MKNKILWRDWKDPLTKYTGPTDDDEDSGDGNSRTSTAVIMGPMGVMSVDDGCLSSSNNKFYVGHTNFNITKNVRDAIQNVAGVETLRLISRYRFIISFGEVFQHNFVKEAIECALGIIDKKPINKVNRIQMVKNFCIRCKNWAICEYPNGKIDFCKDESREPVFECIKRFKQIQGSKISTSWD